MEIFQILPYAIERIYSDPVVFALAGFGYALAGVALFMSLKKRGFFANAELAEAQKQILQQEKWMKLMQENMTDGLAVYSNRGDLLYVNPAALKLLDTSHAKARQRRDFLLPENLGNEEIELMRKKILDEGQIITRKVEVKLGQSSRVVEARLSPVYGKFKNVIAIAAAYRDITDLHNLERNKEEFIQVASHELRTPLTAIRGFLSILQMDRYGRMSAKQKNLVEKALYACTRLSKLVDNLLMVAKIEEKGMDLNLENVDVEELINLAIQELAGEADRCSVKIRTLMPVLKLPKITADREKLQHVLSNLLGNAIKYTPEGGNVFVEPKVRNGVLEVSISDTGVGIAQEDLDRLFQKFERIQNSRSVRVGGSGLGLVIVKSLVELHGGKVIVNSRVGQGSTFTVTLPMTRRTAYA